MPKFKLTGLSKSDLPKLKAAADFLGVQIIDGTTMGNKATVEVSTKTGDQLFELGRLIDQVTIKESKPENVEK